MKYTKKDMGRYRIHIIKTDQYKSITAKINFKKEIVKEEVTIREFLLDMLLMTNKKYPTRKLFQLEKERRYDILTNGSSILSGRYSILSLSVKFLDEKYTEMGMAEQSLQFLLDMIFSPNVEKNAFSKELFFQQKKNMEEYIKTFDEIPENYTAQRFDEIRGQGTPRSFHKVGYFSDLKKITPEKLYDYYQSFLEDEIIDVFLIGNIEDHLVSYLTNHLSFKGTSPISKKHGIYDDNIHQKEVMETGDYEQSKLLINLKATHLTEYESKYVLGAYSYLLGGSPESMLFQEIREKESLCYAISANSSIVYHTVAISAGIDQEAYLKTVEKIKIILQKLKQGNFDDSLIQQYKTIYQSSLSSIGESSESLLNIYENHEYINSDFKEEKEKQIKKLTKKDVVSLAQKIHLDTIYFLKGVADYGDS